MVTQKTVLGSSKVFAGASFSFKLPAMRHAFLCLILQTLLTLPVWAAPDDDATTAPPVITGEIAITRVAPGESLIEIARREGIGFDLLVNSNPQHDPWTPEAGAEIILPRQAILPAGAEKGIVINLAEMRLYHIFDIDSHPVVDLYPLGIGREGRETPEGVYRVVVKKEQPEWRVPDGLREQDPSLPAIVPPGQNNPLGAYWLGLSANGYGIHGTNRPLGVGRRISYGCLRMYPEDIATLYSQVTVGTPVLISYQPVKAARRGDSMLLEAHPDYLHRFGDLFQEALTAISRTGWPGEVDYARVRDVVKEARSMPVDIGRLPAGN